MIVVCGYAPESMNFCPECGSESFSHQYSLEDGKMKCDDCGLTCYIVEGEDSHSDDDGEIEVI